MKISSVLIGAAVAGSAYNGYQAYTYEHAPSSLQTAGFGEATPPEFDPQTSEQAITDIGGKLARVAMLEDPILGMPQEQSNNTVVGLGFLAGAVVIKAVAYNIRET